MTSLAQYAEQVKNYASLRPTYPPELYRVVADACASKDLCIDVGCGTGQASVTLAWYFTTVIGIDTKRREVEAAEPRPHAQHRLKYLQGTCDQLPATEGSVSCITAAQSAHLFDLPVFYKEVDRVLKPGGVLALWTYGTIVFEKDDLKRKLVDDFYSNTLDGFWDCKRQLVEDRYRDIDLPETGYTSRRIETGLDICRQWSADELVAYLRSWDGYTTYCQQQQVEAFSPQDPVEEIHKWLLDNGYEKDISISWPVTLVISVKEELNEQDMQVVKWFPSTCTTPGTFTNFDVLKSLAKRNVNTSCSAPAREKYIQLLISNLLRDGVGDPELPPTLLRFYKTAASWSFYGMKTYSVARPYTDLEILYCIFGDEDLPRDEFGVEVATPGWIGFAKTSDGFLMINCNKSSPYFGQVWNYDDTRNYEKIAAPCLDALLERILHLLEWNRDGSKSLKVENEGLFLGLGIGSAY